MKWFVLLAVMLFVLSMGSLSVAAEKEPQDPRFFLREVYVIEGKTYTKAQIIRDFLKIAFSSHLWFEDIPMDSSNGWTIRGVAPIGFVPKMDNVKKSGLYDSWVMSLPKGDIKFDAINKWAGDVTIGFGWPPFDAAKRLRGVEEDEVRGSEIDPARLTEISETISKKMEGFLPKLSALTGQSVNFIDPKDETARKYAKIRIIVSDSFLKDVSSFKSDRLLAGYTHQLPNGWGVRLNERDSFLNAVRFSPFSPYQVEGYIFPDQRNNIQFAVCQLNPKLGEKVMLTLLTECLARVLGLPEGGILHKSSIFYPRATAEEAAIDRPTFSPYDEAIISLLYCDKLKAGMGRSDVLRTLYFEPSCFKKFKLRER